MVNGEEAATFKSNGTLVAYCGSSSCSRFSALPGGETGYPIALRETGFRSDTVINDATSYETGTSSFETKHVSNLLLPPRHYFINKKQVTENTTNQSLSCDKTKKK